jgi:hypothetical protein
MMRKTPFNKLCAVLLLSSFPLNAAAAVPGVESRLRDGTRVAVRLSEPLSSATAKSGDIITFEVLENLVIDGDVVIKAGTPARGTVVEAAEKRRMGRAGKLAYTLTETTSVDRQVIKLRASQDKKGDSHVTSTVVTTAAVAVFVPVAAPFFLLRKGKDITIPEGTRVDAFIDGEHVVRLTQETVASNDVTSKTGSGPKMTNGDVLGLASAGFSEDVILARITSGVTDFDLTTAAMIKLKRAGLSDRIIQTMAQAKR